MLSELFYWHSWRSSSSIHSAWITFRSERGCASRAPQWSTKRWDHNTYEQIKHQTPYTIPEICFSATHITSYIFSILTNKSLLGTQIKKIGGCWQFQWSCHQSDDKWCGPFGLLRLPDTLPVEGSHWTDAYGIRYVTRNRLFCMDWMRISSVLFATSR